MSAILDTGVVWGRPRQWNSAHYDISRSNLLETTLNGQDNLLYAKNFGQRYDYPNPVSKTYDSSLRTGLWNGLQSTLQNAGIRFVTRTPLYGNQHIYNRRRYAEALDSQYNNGSIATRGGDQFYGTGGPSYDYPNPVWESYHNDLRTFINPLYLESGNDSFLTGGLGPRYDYPNPTPKAYHNDLRTTTWSGLQTTLNFIRPPFQLPDIAHYYWTVKSYPQDLRTFLDFYVEDDTNPPQPSEYPNPVVRTYPQDLRSWVSSRIVGTSLVQPVTPPDYQNPVRKAYPTDLLTVINTNIVAYASSNLPFQQFEWPAASPAPYPLSLRSWISRVLSSDPFKQTEWINPASRPYPSDIRSWLQQSLSLPGLVSVAPFTLGDLSYPYRTVYQDATKIRSTFYSVDITEPFEPIDWPNPVVAAYALSLRTSLSTSLASGVIVLPFRQLDWQNPTAQTVPLDVRTWLASSRGLLIAVLPFSQTNYPNPRSAPYPTDLRSWISTFISGTPFKQTEWPNPTAKTYPADVRTWLQRTGILTGQTPFHLTEWETPTRKIYVLDLRTGINLGYHILPVFFAAPACDTFSTEKDIDFLILTDDDFKVRDC